MSKDAIIDALAHLVALLIAERNAPPEEGGWIRTRNTAYKPPKPSEGSGDPESEKHAQIGSIDAKKIDGRGLNHPGTNHCSRCGKAGRNRLTCGATFLRHPPSAGQGRKDWVPVQVAGGRTLYTNQAHRRSGE